MAAVVEQRAVSTSDVELAGVAGELTDGVAEFVLA